jgi:hypothetical protein
MIIANSTIEDSNEAAWSLKNNLMRLLNNSTLSNEEFLFLSREIEDSISTERGEELSYYLSNNQLDPINSGNNYNMSDINRKIRRECL